MTEEQFLANGTRSLLIAILMSRIFFMRKHRLHILTGREDDLRCGALGNNQQLGIQENRATKRRAIEAHENHGGRT